MVRQWIHKPRLPKQLELFALLLHIAQSPVQFNTLPTLPINSSKPTTNKPIHINLINPTKQTNPQSQSQPPPCTASPPPLLAPPAPPTPATSQPYVHSLLFKNQSLQPIKTPQTNPIAITDPPPIRAKQQHRRPRRRRRQRHREGRRGSTEGQGGYWSRHRTGTGQGQRGFGHCFRQGERACRPGAGQGCGAGGQGEGHF